MADDLDAFLQKAAQNRKKKRQPGIVILDADQSQAAPPPSQKRTPIDSQPLPSAAQPLPSAAPPRPTAPPRPRATAPPRTAAQPRTTSQSREQLESSSTTMRELRAAQAPDIGAHVQAHLDSATVTERSSHLGEHVGLADDDMDAHVHQVFDHQVGQLSRTEPEGRKSPEAMTSGQVRSLFSSADDVRRAVILSEILTRPDFDRLFGG